MQRLEGIRVVEVAEMVAGPYASKLLADLGAEVIKVEPPQGDRARSHGPFPPDAPGDAEQSGLFLGLNTNKTSVVADLTTSEGKARLRDLVAEADIVVHSMSAVEAAEAGLDGPALLQDHPALVVCAVTPFGHTGPHADWRGEEINVVHGGGWGYLIPGDAPDPDAAPLTVFGHPANCQAGMAAALAAVAAYFKSQRTGHGEYIDVAAMAHVAAMLEASFIAWSYSGNVASRSDGRLLNPWGIYPCSDGLIFLVTVEQDQWLRLVEMMGSPDWAALEVFATPADRAENRDILQVYIEEWTRQHRVDDLFHEGQRQRICFAPVFTMEDLAGQSHLADRGFFHRATHDVAGELVHMGAPFHSTPDPWLLHRAAPTLDPDRVATFSPRSESRREHDAAAKNRRPLEGVRVLDFTWVWAGPFATMHLAFLGAEVIKVESSDRPGLGRRLAIHPPELEPTLNTCGYFNQWDQAKKSIELDLTDPQSIELVLELVSECDVVVDNYATGVMDRLGLSDDVLRAANSDVVIASITGFGHSGPLMEYMGYGPTTCPLSGLTSMTGEVGKRPVEAGISFGDPAAGLAAAFAITSSLVTRSRGDEPARIDVSLWEATAVNAVEGWMAHALGAPAFEPMGNRSPAAAPHGVFRCAGADSWVSIACATDEQWAAFASLLGETVAADRRFADLGGRKQYESELEAAVSAYTAAQTAWEVATTLQEHGIAAYPSLPCPDLETTPQLVARDFWVRFDHPEVGERTHSGFSWRTHNADNGVPHRAPLLGEHTTEVLANLTS